MPYKDPNKRKEYMKEWREAHKESELAKMKAYRQAHKEERNAYQKVYLKADVNSLGQTKYNIRNKSRRYLIKYGKLIEGYQIHHCCSYTEPYKFIYCPTNVHRLIHSYLRQHNIDADSDHYEYIKHLLDDSVIKYNIE